MIVKDCCEICGNEMENEMCCTQASGDCGCLGLPIHPSICSEKCWSIKFPDDSFKESEQIPDRNINRLVSKSIGGL